MYYRNARFVKWSGTGNHTSKAMRALVSLLCCHPSSTTLQGKRNEWQFNRQRQTTSFVNDLFEGLVSRTDIHRTWNIECNRSRGERDLPQRKTLKFTPNHYKFRSYLDEFYVIFCYLFFFCHPRTWLVSYDPLYHFVCWICDKHCAAWCVRWCAISITRPTACGWEISAFINSLA